MAQEKPSLAKQLLTFGIGGVSGCVATCCIQPLDMVKVRIQLLSGENPGKKFGPLGVAKNMMKETGLLSFYKGLDAGLMRQLIYCTARFGLFFNLVDYIKFNQGGQNLSLAQKGGCSLVAGGIAAMIGTPADLILIRMQSDGTLPKEQRRNYKGFFDAARRIPAEEGITSLWKGGVPTIVRAMSINVCMFTTYAEATERLNKLMPDNKNLAFVLASFFAGGVASAGSLPFDNAKTKLQAQKPAADGTLQYKNIFHALAVTAKQSGAAGLWVGLPTYIMRISPHVMITLIVSEQLKKVLL